MPPRTIIRLDKESFLFSSGHFTLFSATERENIHGHNYRVTLAFETDVKADGMAFNYNLPKEFFDGLCEKLNEHFLLPGRSPYLRVEEGGDYIYAHFNGEKIPFLPRDVIVLPLANISLEELSRYFLEAFLAEFRDRQKHPIYYAEVTASSAPGQSAAAVWRA